MNMLSCFVFLALAQGRHGVLCFLVVIFLVRVFELAFPFPPFCLFLSFDLVSVTLINSGRRSSCLLPYLFLVR